MKGESLYEGYEGENMTIKEDKVEKRVYNFPCV